MTAKHTPRNRSTKRRPAPPSPHPSTWEAFASPDGAMTLQEWRRTVGRTPAVHLVELHDHLVA
jgi:hypothetical protein